MPFAAGKHRRVPKAFNLVGEGIAPKSAGTKGENAQKEDTTTGVFFHFLAPIICPEKKKATTSEFNK
jgi:hypothetical protein